jgi:hypothetical protein
MFSDKTSFLKNLTYKIFIAGVCVSAVLAGKNAIAQDSDLTGGWTGTMTIRPPQQEEIKKYTVMLKFGAVERRATSGFEDVLSQSFYKILEARIAPEGSSKSIDLKVSGEVERYSGGSYGSVYLASKAFSPCDGELTLNTLEFDSSGNSIDAKVQCQKSGSKWHDPRYGKITLQRSGSVGSSVKTRPATTQTQNTQPQGNTQTPQSPSSNSLDEIRDKVPSVIRNIFK